MLSLLVLSKLHKVCGDSRLYGGWEYTNVKKINDVQAGAGVIMWRKSGNETVGVG